MLKSRVRVAAMATTAVSVLLLASCGARQPIDTAPATGQAGYGASETPDLMGAPPTAEAAPSDGLLGGPPESQAAPAPAPTPARVSTSGKLKTWRRPDGTLVTAMAPIPNPKQPRRAVRYAPRAGAASQRVHAVAKPAPAPVAKPAPAVAVAKPAPKVATPAPAALKPVVAAKPPAVLAKAPTPALAAPAKPTTKLGQLQAAVAGEATKGAVLASGESLAKGQEGQVTLALPATLGDLIKKEAAKLGLTKAAKKTSAYANLEGEGYEITPNGKQTAVLKPGEPATFAWQVKPTPAAKGQLTSEFGVELNGAKPAQSFSLGSIMKQVTPIEAKVKSAAKGFKLPFAMPNLGAMGDIDVPYVGKVPAKSVLGGALVLLALLILVAISRNAAAAKAREERRRKFRTLTDYGRNEMEFDAPKSAEVNYVNPMVAAAAGALAGAAVAHAVDHGHDTHEAHAPAEHAPFEHTHDDHGHEAPGHDDHAHSPVHHAQPVHDHGHADPGHDDHAPDAHAEAHDGHAHDDHAHDDHAHDDAHAHAPAHDDHAVHVVHTEAPAAEHAPHAETRRELEPAH